MPDGTSYHPLIVLRFHRFTESLRPHFRIAPGSPTTRQVGRPVNTSAFGTNPADEPITSGLLVNRPRRSDRLHHRLAHRRVTDRGWLDACEQCQFAPFPVAVHIDEANFAQPRQLSFKIEKLVRRILIHPGNRLEEPGVETGSWRSDVLKITECAAWSEKLENLLVQCAFSFVRYVVNRKTRDHCVEQPHRRHFVFKIV